LNVPSFGVKILAVLSVVLSQSSSIASLGDLRTDRITIPKLALA